MCGHEWPAVVYSRNKNGCPACSGKVLIKGKNDLLSQNPSLAKEWNYEKNNGIRPDEITVNNGKRVWWKCSVCGHEWPAYISNRVKGSGCTECFKKIQADRSRRAAMKRNGSIVVSNPEILELWNYKRNQTILPNDVTKGSQQEVWWICPTCGYEWPSTISNIVRGNRCPACSHHRRRRVIQMDKNGNIIREFESCAEASKVTGISSTVINRVVNGQGKTAGGYIWKYVD